MIWINLYIYSDENVTAPTTSGYKPNPQLSHFGIKTRVKVTGSCLKKDKIRYDHGSCKHLHCLFMRYLKILALVIIQD